MALLTSGTVRLVGLPVTGGLPVARLAMNSGGTAFVPGGSPNLFFGLYDDDLGSETGVARKLLATSADDAGTGWPANTLKTLAMTVAYRVRRSGFLYAAILVVGTTPPSLLGYASAPQLAVSLAPAIAGDSTAGQVALPATAAAPGGSGNVPYVYTAPA
jgi:hypothetical protein